MRYWRYFFIGVALLIGNNTYAAMHHYTCADALTPAGTATGCINTDEFVFVGGAASYTDNGIVFPIDDSKTYYVSYTATYTPGSGTDRVQFNGDGGNTNHTLSVGTFQEEAVAVGTINPNGKLIIRVDDAGSVTNLCVDDDGYSCTGSPPPTPSFTPVFDTGTTTCTVINASTTECVTTSGTRTVDNPVQDLFAGFILFFMSFGGVVWFFRKK